MDRVKHLVVTNDGLESVVGESILFAVWAGGIHEDFHVVGITGFLMKYKTRSALLSQEGYEAVGTVMTRSALESHRKDIADILEQAQKGEGNA